MVQKAGGPSVPDVGKFIHEQRKRARVSLRKLSELAGVSNPYLSQIERGLRKPSAEVVQQIMQGMAKALRTSGETLYEQAGLPFKPRPAESSALDAILRDPALTQGQQRELAELYTQFRTETAQRRASRRPKQPRATSGGTKS